MSLMWVIVPFATVVNAAPAAPFSPVDLSAYEPADSEAFQEFALGAGLEDVQVYGSGRQSRRVYSGEFLPALFDRRLRFNDLTLETGRLEWMFTGPQAGFTIILEAGRVTSKQRIYDSFGLHPQDEKDLARHPEKPWAENSAEFREPLGGPLRELAVILDNQLNLIVLLNGREMLRQHCPFDVSQHQLRWTGETGRASGVITRPIIEPATVDVLPANRQQTMLGFGGIATPTAYALLSEEGKREWWRLVREYNLLIQREYPNGVRLNRAMDNFDRLEDATPHYYGDNFPNGEISDFDYIRTLRSLGGKVWFEFWGLPLWARQDYTDETGKLFEESANPDMVADAIVAYCRTSRERAGRPPEVVGMQNEVWQPAPIWHELANTLRRSLDEAGFNDVRIHLTDDGRLDDGIERAKAIKSDPDAWAAIHYAASHMYDYQDFFTNPDGFDARLKQWREVTGAKPFLSTELCVNYPAYQWLSYRIAFAMGQLYHKNLTIANAEAICYCWTLLNVVQPSYGWTRSLFVPDPARGFAPVASSHQLRVFGAYSRRVFEGFTRVDTQCADPSILSAAFVGDHGETTVVVTNRGTAPRALTITGLPGPFSDVERADPYMQNESVIFTGFPINLPPGAITTVSNVPLQSIPPEFVPSR